jgi:site-specific DNA-cytosine methylase
MFAALVLALREVHAPAQVFMKVERPAKAVASLPPLNTWTQDMGEAWLEREVAPRYPGEWVKPFSAALLKGFDEDDMGRRLLLSNERALAKCLGPQAPPGLAKCIFEAVRVLKG